MGAPTDKSTVSEANEGFLSIRIDASTKDKLERLAEKNERTLTGEVRLALRRHLEMAA